jgi:transposase
VFGLVIEEVVDQSERVLVRARTEEAPMSCPDCGAISERVHAWHERTVADVPLNARKVVVVARFRRLRCQNPVCGRRTFREQVPGVLERYQRRTVQLAAQLRAVVRELAGRASERVLTALAMGISRHTAIRILLRLPLPPRQVPAVLGVDDFALRRRLRYATVFSTSNGAVSVRPNGTWSPRRSS